MEAPDHRAPPSVERERPQEVAMLVAEPLVGDCVCPVRLQLPQLMPRQVAADIARTEAGALAARDHLRGGVMARDRALDAVGQAPERLVETKARVRLVMEHL